MTFNPYEVRTRREAHGLTQDQLAALVRAASGLRTNGSQICSIEHGRVPNPTGETVLALAQALDCEMSDFYAGGATMKVAKWEPKEFEIGPDPGDPYTMRENDGGIR